MTPLGLVSADGVALQAVVHEYVGARALGAVVMSHGITVDMDEGGGMFVRLAARLSAAGFDVLRFSYRGHGRSGGTQRGVTVAGEMLDLQAAVDAAVGRLTGGLSVVAASFGAVPLALSLPYLDTALTGMVLWNPVLDSRCSTTRLDWAQPTRGGPAGSRSFVTALAYCFQSTPYGGLDMQKSNKRSLSVDIGAVSRDSAA